ncbi:MAG: pyridoxal-phosphate dependent enzyme, partial [Firmicutes bacterium]|nr:pyridoxal-phosphate dependent enzyme [Bacillota bacterium]
MIEKGSWTVKKGLAEMLKGGVIMDVTTPEQAKIAEEAGACAVMALERVPADIRAAGGVARMADPTVILRIMDAVTIPVMAKARIGHFVEAQILESLGVDYIDESEVLTPADEGTDGAIRKAYEILNEAPDKYYMPNQFVNKNNILAHYETTGPEIFSQTKGEIDVFVAGMGTTGTLMGVSMFLKEKKPAVRIVGIEPTQGHAIQG